MIREKLLCLFVLFFALISVDAQDRKSIREIREASRPGEHHDLLNPLLGEWKVRIQYRIRPDANPEMAIGKAEFRWIIGRRFLEQVFNGKGAAGAFEGRGLIGYDNIMNHYSGTWIDSMNSGMTWLAGNAESGGRVIQFKATQTDPLAGTPSEYRTFLRILDSDRLQYIVYTKSPESDSEIAILQMDYERKR